MTHGMEINSTTRWKFYNIHGDILRACGFEICVIGIRKRCSRPMLKQVL